jgi:hypothetical protein
MATVKLVRGHWDLMANYLSSFSFRPSQEAEGAAMSAVNEARRQRIEDLLGQAAAEIKAGLTAGDLGNYLDFRETLTGHGSAGTRHHLSLHMRPRTGAELDEEAKRITGEGHWHGSGENEGKVRVR